MSELSTLVRKRLASIVETGATPFPEAAFALAAEIAAQSGQGEDDPAPYAAAFLLRHASGGGICLLADIAPEGWTDPLPAWPTDWTDWNGHPCVGRPGDFKPLIADKGRLYLHRLHCYETRLAEAFALRSAYHDISDTTVARLKELFHANREVPDFQRLAALAALRRDFAIITGGPGTGKTTTVLNLLAALLETAPGLRITLAAPTGKAAARLGETLGNRVASLPVSPETKDSMPRSAVTLHKLLGIHPVSGKPKFDAKNPLLADVVLVDEASMVDLPMMARLVDALKPGARLILLGDRDQLASVEVGSVLGDLCAAGEATPVSARFAETAARVHDNPLPQDCLHIAEADTPKSPLTDAVVRLTLSRRFTADSVIGRLCTSFNDGRTDDALGLLREKNLLNPPPSHDSLETWIASRLDEHWAHFTSAAGPAEALRLLDRYRLLCALRVGTHGVEALNTLVRTQHRRKCGATTAIFDGLPFLVLSNDASLGLANGDTGVFKNDPASGRLLAWLPGVDGLPRALAPARLPAWEPAYAMSIHKSQGSEFDIVETLIPPGIHPIMTRELLYTAASRARSTVLFFGEEITIRSALARTVTRPSGLAARLTPESARRPPSST